METYHNGASARDFAQALRDIVRDSDSATEAIWMLEQFGVLADDGEHVRLFTEALHAEDVEVRIAALNFLARSADPSVGEEVAELLSDLEPRVRFAAACAMKKVGSAATLGTILMATHDPVPAVRGAAIEAVGCLPAEQAVDALLPILAADDELSRGKAAAALGHFHINSLVGQLTPLLTDRSAFVREMAERSLAQIASSGVAGNQKMVSTGGP